MPDDYLAYRPEAREPIPTPASTTSPTPPSLSNYGVYSEVYRKTPELDAFKSSPYGEYLTVELRRPPPYKPEARPRYWFHHSSFLAGEPVAAAGEIRVSNGVLKTVSNNSGHYQPQPGYLIQFLLELRKRSPFYDLSNVRVELYDGSCKSRFCPLPTAAYNAHEFIRKAPASTPCTELDGTHSYSAGNRLSKPPALEQYLPAMPAGYDRTGVKRTTAATGSAQTVTDGTGARVNAHQGEQLSSQTGGEVVKYLDDTERRRFEVRIASDGSTLEIGGDPWVKLDTAYGGTPNGCSLEFPPLFNGSFIYVMSPAGKIYAASMLHVILELNNLSL
jgi:hypothetical protein